MVVEVEVVTPVPQVVMVVVVEVVMDLITHPILVTQHKAEHIAPEAVVEVISSLGSLGNFGAGNGGSGIVVLRYQIGSVSTAKATGGSISFYNGKTIHTFTSSGTFATTSDWSAADVEYVVMVVVEEVVVLGWRCRCL